MHPCCRGRTFSVGSNLRNVTGRDAVRDCVPANRGSRKRGLPVRVFHDEIVGRAEECILHIGDSIGLDRIILKIDENDQRGLGPNGVGYGNRRRCR